MKKYDYLIVGAGLYGSVFARQMTDAGKRCLVIDRREHIGGNVHCEIVEGIRVHQYGAHIFHTSSRIIWDYVNRFAEFTPFINSPLAVYRDELYNLPFNMNTFHQMWGVRTPEEAQEKIAGQIAALNIGEPKNLEEQALKLVGPDIYEKLVKGYTEKQWGRPCTELPAFIIRRLPLRFTYDNNYFSDRWQGLPSGGYDAMIEKLLAGSEVRLNTPFVPALAELAGRVVYTGSIDEYFGFCLGHLQYRTVTFETEIMDCENYQGNAVVNYTERDIPYTRIIEHKHFEFGTQPKTVISREYPTEWRPGMEPYYPVNDTKNSALYVQYKALAEKEPNVIFGGRLGSYRYYDMDDVIRSALSDAVRHCRRTDRAETTQEDGRRYDQGCDPSSPGRYGTNRL